MKIEDSILLSLFMFAKLHTPQEHRLKRYSIFKIQSNLDGLNTDGSFTMANSNSFLNPNEILPIAQENKYLRKFSFYFLWGDSNEYTQHTITV